MNLHVEEGKVKLTEVEERIINMLGVDDGLDKIFGNILASFIV